MKKIVSFLIMLNVAISAAAQNVGIGTTNPNSNALLEIQSNNKGFLMPRLSAAAKNAMGNVAKGMMVYDTSNASFYYHDGKRWRHIGEKNFDGLLTDYSNSPVVTANIGSSSTTALSGILYDNGGPAGNYAANSNNLYSVNRSVTITDSIVGFKVIIEEMNLESPYDSIEIYSDLQHSTVITGTTTGTYFFSGTDFLRFRFRSNAVNQLAGFKIVWSVLVASKTLVEEPPLYGWYFNTRKLAMRGGLRNANEWSTDSLGKFSFAYGYDAKASGISSVSFMEGKASGDYSVAVGSGVYATGDYAYSIGYGGFFSNIASGDGSIAIGGGNSTSGLYSVALGSLNFPSNSYSMAMGYGNSATNEYAIAIGNNNESTGQRSLALGSTTEATGNYSTTIGRNTVASGESSTAIGKYTDATGYASTATGDSTLASGTMSFAGGFRSNATNHSAIAFGNTALASGTSSVAFGNTASATGISSVALGHHPAANGNYSVALGDNATATGGYAIAIGASSNATGGYSVAMGTGANSVGGNSVAMGYATNAEGSFSTSAGLVTVSRGYAGTAIGMYNDPIIASPQTFPIDATPLFIIGNGDGASSLSNAMIVRKDGKVGVGTNVPRTKLHVDGGSDASLSTSSGHFIIGDVNSLNLVFDDNEILARNSSAISTLYLQNSGGAFEIGGTAAKPGGGSWAATSDARLKQNIKPYSDGLQQLLKINPVFYQYNQQSGYNTQKQYIGVLAQDIKEVAPYMVGTFTKDNTEYLNVDNSAMTYMLINAVKELSKQNEELKTRLEKLETLILKK